MQKVLKSVCNIERKIIQFLLPELPENVCSWHIKIQLLSQNKAALEVDYLPLPQSHVLQL
jgi:hypothetical protein